MSHVWGLFSHPDREMQVINRENGNDFSSLHPPRFADGGDSGDLRLHWHYTDWLEFWRWHYSEVILVYRTGAGCLVLRRYAGWGRGDGAGHLVDGAQLPTASVTCALHGLRGLRCNSAVFKRSGGALSAGLVVCAGRHGGAVYTGYLLYLGIPSFLNINKEEGLSFSSSTLAIGVLVLEVLLALTVILWGYGYRLF